MMMKISAFVFAITLLYATQSYCHPTYTGYSGAPGANGRCASSCHGTSGGTIQVSGFPTEYIPGQAYTISVYHNGGSTIRQFNGSCRIGTGSQNAGVITAGTRSVTYNTSGETNGIHLSTTSQDSCNFTWTAPAMGTGTVRLYIAGQQGNSSGANSTINIVSNEQQSGIDDDKLIPKNHVLIANYPNPFNASTLFKFSIPVAGKLEVDIYNIVGQKVESLFNGNANSGEFSIVWDASQFPSGVYFCRLTVDNKAFNHRITLLK